MERRRGREPATVRVCVGQRDGQRGRSGSERCNWRRYGEAQAPAMAELWRVGARLTIHVISDYIADWLAGRMWEW